MQLNPNDVHVWSMDLMTQPEQEKKLLALLSPDEIYGPNAFVLFNIVNDLLLLVAHYANFFLCISQ
jgi:hypothetical protein